MSYNVETLSYPSSNGVDLVSAMFYLPTGQAPRFIVQIAHGMCEYFDRYQEFARYLCEQGAVVCGNDHIGHRHSVRSSDGLGFFAEQDGWRCLIEDVHSLEQIAREKYPHLPYFLLGHSMGSFIVRCYLSLYGNGLNGAILSGTGGPNASAAGGRIASALCATQGSRSRNRLLDQLIFGKFNERFEHRTSKDWLTRDTDIVDAYVSDPYCMFLFTNSAMRDLAALCDMANSPDWASTLPRDLPIYLFSGDQDPVGDYGKGVKKVYRMIKDANVFDVTLKLYRGGRHEMLNEINRQDVYRDIYEWIRRKI